MLKKKDRPPPKGLAPSPLLGTELVITSQLGRRNRRLPGPSLPVPGPPPELRAPGRRSRRLPGPPLPGPPPELRAPGAVAAGCRCRRGRRGGRGCRRGPVPPRFRRDSDADRLETEPSPTREQSQQCLPAELHVRSLQLKDFTSSAADSPDGIYSLMDAVGNVNRTETDAPLRARRQYVRRSETVACCARLWYSGENVNPFTGTCHTWREAEHEAGRLFISDGRSFVIRSRLGAAGGRTRISEGRGGSLRDPRGVRKHAALDIPGGHLSEPAPLR